jgi:hypothetical protein
MIRDIKVDDSYKRDPEEDFKKVDVVPGMRELTPVYDSQQMNIRRRRMPEQGDLGNKHNYLDIVFRLLHEDAISDLRDGITEIRYFQGKKVSKAKIK